MTNILDVDFMNVVQPFDLLAYHGTGVVSSVIRGLQKKEIGSSEFSHVDIVITSEIFPGIPQLKPGRKYVVGSNLVIPKLTDGVADVRTGKTRLGVQIRDLEEVIDKFYKKSDENYICWSRLPNNPWLVEKNKKDILSRMETFIAKFGYKPYERNPLELLGSICKRTKKMRIDIEEKIIEGTKVLTIMGVMDKLEHEDFQGDGLFCSEVAVMIYQAIGVINKKVDPRDVAPMHFFVDTLFPRIGDDPIEIIRTKTRKQSAKGKRKSLVEALNPLNW
ncbi:hypothetical protein D3C87_1167820 [compost metagenome]